MLKALADLLLLVSPGGSLFAQQRRSLLRHAPPGVMKLRGGADALRRVNRARAAVSAQCGAAR